MTRHDKGPPERERPAAIPDSEPTQKSAKAPPQHDQDHFNKPVGRRQIPAVGSTPDIDSLLVGSLLWCSAADADDVLHVVHDDDVSSPHLATILAAIREMISAGEPVSPQTVAGYLRRQGHVQQPVHRVLLDAVTNGAAASAEAVRVYAAAAVAGSLRRRVESGGTALVSAANESAEDELPFLAADVATAITSTHTRLMRVRGEVKP